MRHNTCVVAQPLWSLSQNRRLTIQWFCRTEFRLNLALRFSSPDTFSHAFIYSCIHAHIFFTLYNNKSTLHLCGSTKIKYEREDSLKGLNSSTQFVLSFVGVRNGSLKSDDKFTAKTCVSSQQVSINAGKLQMLAWIAFIWWILFSEGVNCCILRLHFFEIVCWAERQEPYPSFHLQRWQFEPAPPGRSSLSR